MTNDMEKYARAVNKLDEANNFIKGLGIVPKAYRIKLAETIHQICEHYDVSCEDEVA